MYPETEISIFEAKDLQTQLQRDWSHRYGEHRYAFFFENLKAIPESKSAKNNKCTYPIVIFTA